MTENLILQFGGFGIIAILFILVLKWLLAHVEEIERRQCEKEKRFYELAEDFNLTIKNHLAHNTEVLQDIKKILEELARRDD